MRGRPRKRAGCTIRCLFIVMLNIITVSGLMDCTYFTSVKEISKRNFNVRTKKCKSDVRGNFHR